MLEQKIDALTEATRENTKAVKEHMAMMSSMGGAKTTTATTTAKADKPAAPKNTREAMVQGLKDLKAKVSAEAAKAVIKEVGGVDGMKDIPDDKIDAVFDAAAAKIKAAAAAAEDDM